MPCDPNFLADIKLFDLLDEYDPFALAEIVDQLKVPPGPALRGLH